MANLITRQIPNALTLCNLLSGCVAIACALEGDHPSALAFILLGALFDFFDGFAARLLGVSSPIGKELDSLADDVTFGVAPAALVFSWLASCTVFYFHGPLGRFLPWLAFFMAAFSALRLANFNIDERQTSSFIGLPTPANALFWSALVVGHPFLLWESQSMVAVVVVAIFLSCWLLVSDIPMFSLKFKHWGWNGNRLRYVFLLSCLPLLIIFGVVGISMIIAWYVVLSVLANMRKNKL